MKPWQAGDKALLLVSHVTRLAYAEPVVEAHSEIRKTPIDTGLQRVVTHKLKITPSTRLHSYVDYFGSHVEYINQLEPHDALEICAESVVETTDAVCCGPNASYDIHERALRVREFQHWSPMVPPLPHYASVPHRVRAEIGPDAFLEALEGLGRVFIERFRYDPDATDVHSSPEVLFEVGGGVCQDLAHAMIGVLRLAGIPSRYVSGYIYDPADGAEGDRLHGAAASHAWVQVWHRELGWVGIDPTNDKLVDWQYVRVATGRDYADVQPLRGVFVGPLDQQLEVDVSVRRIG